MKIKAVGAYSAKQPLEPMDITGVNQDRMMSKSKSLTVAFAIPISTRSVPSGRGRFTPACRVMKLWGVW